MQATALPPAVPASLHLPEKASVWTRLQVAYRALRILEKRPDDGYAAPIFNAAMDGDIFEQHASRLAATEAGRALLAERPTLQGSSVDLSELAQFPEGTVGHAFARYFADNKIQPFESPYAPRTEGEYLVRWYRETHDLHHVLTGYGTDPLGEMEVQAFAAGNLGLRSSLMILIFAAVLRPHGLPPFWKYFDRVREAHRRGRASANLFTLRYERLFSMTVEAARELLRRPSQTEA